VTFWGGSWSRSANPYLLLMDPDPTPDPTPFFSDFKDGKKKFLHIFFLKLISRHIIFSLKNVIFC
jgi:hypothetical protein